MMICFQRESSKLHKQLDEVLLKLEHLEKQTVEYEQMKTELEKTKVCVKHPNFLPSLEQNLENKKLKTGKKSLEEDLQKTQDSLRQYLQIAEEHENLKLENANFQQDNDIIVLKNEKRRLEEMLMLLEELWHCVETSQTQENLFLAGEEETPLKNQLQRISSQPLPNSPLKRQISYPSPGNPSPETLLQSLKHSMPKTPPEVNRPKSYQKLKKQNNDQHFSTSSRKRKVSSDVLEHVNTWTEDATKSLLKEMTVGVGDDLLHGDYSVDLQDIKEWFKPLPAALSPVHSPSAELVSVSDDQLMSNTKEEYQSRNEKQEALSSLHKAILQNNTQLEPSDIEDKKSLLKEEVEKSSLLLSPDTHVKSVVSADNLDIEKTLSDSQHMEVEDVFEVMHGCMGSTQDQTAKSGIGNGHSVESFLENDSTQTVVEILLMNQNGDTTELKDTKTTNLKNLLETTDPQQHVESELVHTNSFQSAECKTSQVQPNVPLASNVKSISTLYVNYSKSDSVENKESKSSEPLEMKTVADISTYDIQSILVYKADQAEEDNSKPTEYQKSLDVRKNGGDCSIRPLKYQESSSEDEGFFGLTRKVRGVHSRSEGRIPSEELENVSRNKQCSTAKQMSKDEPQEFLSENRALSTVIMNHEIKPKDTKESESERPRKTLVQLNNESHQQVDGMSADTHSPGVENFVSDVYNHKETSGDSAVGSVEDTSTPCQDTLDPEYATFEKGDISLVPGHNTTTHITPTSCLSLGRVRTEMGPPLHPVVMPLTATPPRFGKHHTPLKPTSISSRLLTDGPKMLSVPVFDSAIPDASKMSLCLTTPSPSCGVPSSPLQFGSATPKHAVPVPGRLPSSAVSASPPAVSQENSMQMLETMYPELSARARTLNILHGNVNLTRAGNENGTSPPSVNKISGNKTISSSSTAFTKTEQKPKGTGVNMLLPKSAKRLRLDNCSPAPPGVASSAEQVMDHQTVIKMESIKSNQEIQSNQEEQRIEKDNKTNDINSEKLMSAILTKLKTEKSILSCKNVQALCRVYTGICRQIGDYQKAHALAYNILKEDFPNASKLILFMVATWPSVLFHETSLCKAVHTVAKLKAEDDILEYLTKYLHWDESPPDDIHKLISSTVKALQEDKDLTFQKHDRHGHDLCPAAWEYIYTLDLLCTQMKWKWTHDYVIGKELWPIMNTWVTQPRFQQSPVRDVSVAAVLRLIGRLGQLGMRQILCKSVQNVAKAINLFGKHGITEGVPNEVQLSAVYAIYDLAPCNPKDAMEALASWRSETTQPVPSAVTSCITQIGSICRQMKS
uniref:KIAA0947-like (H. sapiens) n=1 Tax=Sinocyclocheilus rhinocerous TaxID=307959 RepID=A0A673JPD1_9TELE